ncbi:hypothetical protein SAMN05444285_10565 [Draconibacterium orientale]|uniref:Uncharacterized protein n=1 Tax=Draconibacterium orientale TaxID=1168034 RepID=X5E3T2_9BACT|nr:hypothetical protein FH5T_15735 [Draconibacterium orientale]SET04763.1 hypothetical protein SAMN05444285_10565 [Draconibacterium orientale]
MNFWRVLKLVLFLSVTEYASPLLKCKKIQLDRDFGENPFNFEQLAWEAEDVLNLIPFVCHLINELLVTKRFICIDSKLLLKLIKWIRCYYLYFYAGEFITSLCIMESR